MSRQPSTTAGAGALRMRALRQRRQAGLERLPSPWAWLGLQQAQQLLQQAYRTASWTVAPGDDTADLSELRMREAFAVALAHDFKVLLMDAACKAGCSPQWSGEFDVEAAALLAEVPETWRPEYPQYASRSGFVTGNVDGGMGAVAPMVTGRSSD